jgi:hypothetical protein
MTMSATITSLIRTWVPIAVGSLISWLITLGVTLNPTTEAGLVTALTGVLIAAYYTVIRLGEKRWPFLGVLLGSATPPTYAPSVPADAVVALVSDEGHVVAGEASTQTTGTPINLSAPAYHLIDPTA